MASEPVNITPPAFSGQSGEDPSDWFRRFEKFCSFKGVTGDKKRDLMLYLMIGNAADWVENLAPEKKNSIQTLSTSFHERYDDSESLQHRHAKDMFDRKQRSDERVEDYITHMQKLARQVGLDEKATRFAILNGLRPAIASAVIQKESKTIDEIMSAARLAESAGLATSTDQPVLQQLTEMQTEMRRLTQRIDRCTTSAIRPSSRSPTPPRERRVSFNTSQPRQRQDRPRSSPGQRSTWNRGQPSRNQQFYTSAGPTPCTRCGLPGGHEGQGPRSCRAMGSFCYICSKRNHWARCCRSQGQGQGQGQPYGRSTYNSYGPGQQ